MAHQVKFFMSPEDEKLFLQDLAPLGLTLYPEQVPPDWVAPKVDTALAGTLTDERYFLGAEEIAPIVVDKVKRGPNKGKWMIMEVISPVILWDRSISDDKGQLRSGRLWAELQVSGDTQRRVQKAATFEDVWERIEENLKRRGRTSDPKGYWVLPGAARLSGSGTPLREAGRKGELVKPWR